MNKRLEGAEAILRFRDFAGLDAIEKKRVSKKYRPKVLDTIIRESRTRVEARLLLRAKRAGVRVPHVFFVGKYIIIMERLDAKNIKSENIGKDNLVECAQYLAKLHNNNIVHGDYTPANIIKDSKGDVYIIDFGLGFFSTDLEDYAIDVITMQKSLPEEMAEEFFTNYSIYSKYSKKNLRERIDKINGRGRYQKNTKNDR
jgi:Kae1-associated kinase Bud32